MVMGMVHYSFTIHWHSQSWTIPCSYVMQLTIVYSNGHSLQGPNIQELRERCAEVSALDQRKVN